MGRLPEANLGLWVRFSCLGIRAEVLGNFDLQFGFSASKFPPGLRIRSLIEAVEELLKTCKPGRWIATGHMSLYRC